MKLKELQTYLGVIETGIVDGADVEIEIIGAIDFIKGKARARMNLMSISNTAKLTEMVSEFNKRVKENT